MTIRFAHLDRKYGLPEGTLAAVWAVESGCGRDTFNEGSGARGHFQFMPATYAEVKQQTGFDAWSGNPDQAAEAAGYYLGKLHRQTGGDLNKTLAAYNWGIGNVNRKGMGARPTETVNYCRKILGQIGVEDYAAYSQEYDARDPSARLSREQQLLDEEERRKRRLELRRFGMPEEVVNTMDDKQLLGSAFVVLLMSVVSGFVQTKLEQGEAVTIPPAPRDQQVAFQQVAKVELAPSLLQQTPVDVATNSAPKATPAQTSPARHAAPAQA